MLIIKTTYTLAAKEFESEHHYKCPFYLLLKRNGCLRMIGLLLFFKSAQVSYIAYLFKVITSIDFLPVRKSCRSSEENCSVFATH